MQVEEQENGLEEIVKKYKETKEKNELLIESVLKNPLLLNQILSEASKKIVGEEDTIQTIFLCALGCLVENATKTSYNLIVNDETGAGKDWVTDKTLEILPKEQIIKRTRISEKVFTYWHNSKSEPDWTWDGKVFYNEDISQEVLNSDVFKVMASSGSSATVIVNQVSVDIEIKGKPVIIVTTESSTPSRENTRRFTIVNLDTSINQTEAIMKRQAEASRNGNNLEYDETITQALRLLKRVKVKIPYADMLVEVFPKKHVLMRTHFERFLDYIKASSALHQFQRMEDADGFLVATGKDYDTARKILIKTTSNEYMIPLTKDQKRLLKIIKNTPIPQGLKGLSVSDLESQVTFMSDRWLRKQLDKLANYGFLEKDSEERWESKRRVCVYRHVEAFDIDIPQWKDIECKCSVNSVDSNHSIDSDSSLNSPPANESIESND